MNKRVAQSPSWVTWLSVRGFAVMGMLLALGALALPAWWLTHPPDSAQIVTQAEASVETDLPVLLPETPLLEDLPGGGATESGSEPAPRPTPESYATAKRQPTRPPERLVIPAIDLDAPVVPVGWATVEVGGETVGQWQVPDATQVGWHDTSAGLGQAGNTVLNGHHNLYGQVFRRLVELEAGDVLWLWSGDRQYVYQVTETAILPERGQPIEVRLANAERILPTDEELVTLVTCWPYSGNSHRLVVVAQPARYDPFSGIAIE